MEPSCILIDAPRAALVVKYQYLNLKVVTRWDAPVAENTFAGNAKKFLKTEITDIFIQKNLDLASYLIQMLWNTDMKLAILKLRTTSKTWAQQTQQDAPNAKLLDSKQMKKTDLHVCNAPPSFATCVDK